MTKKENYSTHVAVSHFSLGEEFNPLLEITLLED